MITGISAAPAVAIAAAPNACDHPTGPSGVHPNS